MGGSKKFKNLVDTKSIPGGGEVLQRGCQGKTKSCFYSGATRPQKKGKSVISRKGMGAPIIYGQTGVPEIIEPQTLEANWPEPIVSH